LALRYCKQHEEQFRAEAYALHLQHNNPIKFWKEISKISNSKATTYVNCIGSAGGDGEIVKLWQDHFGHVYNSKLDEKSRDLFYERVYSVTNSSYQCIRIGDV